MNSYICMQKRIVVQIRASKRLEELIIETQKKNYSRYRMNTIMQYKSKAKKQNHSPG